MKIQEEKEAHSLSLESLKKEKSSLEENKNILVIIIKL